MKSKKTFIGLILLLIIVIVAGVVALGDRQPDNQHDDKIYVSIPPLKYIVDRISGNGLNVNVLLPPGVSPETYEPTPGQLKQISDSKALMTIGLIDFEKELFSRFSNTANTNIIELHSGIPLLEGQCSHALNATHNHGVDPHVWTSPRALKTLATNAFAALSLLYPDSLQYRYNLEKLLTDFNKLDAYVESSIQSSGVKYFLIYHPAFSYYANDYSIIQVALEQDGKEPSASHLMKIISDARKDGVSKIFYQKEFSINVVESLAQDVGAEIIPIDPLEENVVNNIRCFTNIITSNEIR